MNDPRTPAYDPLPIFAVAIGVVASAANASGSLDLWDTMVGLILGLILLSFREYAHGSQLQRISFASMAGFCLLLIFGVLGEVVFHQLLGLDAFWRQFAFFVSWLLLSGGAYLLFSLKDESS